MYKSGVDLDAQEDLPFFVEMDPSRRYGRLKEVLGKGATKTVYRAFDEVLGTEVAWNQIKLDSMLRTPEELQRLYSEVHLLKTLSHPSIIQFRASWVDVTRRSFNFITELFTSGTLREYRRRYRRVSLGAIKNWARQILEGLDYLHSHDPPVIHRDLKCDNIFVNGHLGQVKIGDLGLAAVLRGSQHAHSVIGTPEFMAPELYEEEYDELVDVYSFGMCVLEMLTSEYPYNECSNPAQIYKKVTSGKLPGSFYKIEDEEARRFIARCLEKAENRPSATELLKDPFLSSVEDDSGEVASLKVIPKASAPPPPRTRSTQMAITGTLNPEEDTIFLKVQISDKNGPARNIFFPFEITSDTAVDVATEMVKELEITDWEALEIAGMINKEISRLVPITSQKQSFIDYDDHSPRHPFHTNSSLSSSQASLSTHDAQFYQANSDWLYDECNDDASSSHSSSYSDNYEYVNREAKCIGKKIHTRFGPEGRRSKGNGDETRMARTGSLVDIRSQSLHRSLVEEVNKRRMFNTVGALEHIGYCHPDYPRTTKRP